MNDHGLSAKRPPVDVVLFAVVFFAQLLAVAGIIVASIPVAVVGGVITLLSVLILAARGAL